MPKTSKPSYLNESILLSELILVNNAKKLKESPDLYNDEHYEEIEKLRNEIIELENNPKKGSQKKKKEIRNKIRELSSKTFIYRDSEMFGEMINTMADRILTRPQFSNYSFKDEMKSLGIEYVLKYSHSFNPFMTSKISNHYVSSFAYISTIIFNGILQVINKHKKETKQIKEYIEQHQKSFHYSDHNSSIIGPEFENIDYKIINISNEQLENHNLLNIMRSYTMDKPLQFIIPKNYKITEKDYNYIMKYSISIIREK